MLAGCRSGAPSRSDPAATNGTVVSVTDGDTIVVEPWRAAAFPIIKDLMVDRSAFDRIVEQGGFITAPTGGAPDANIIPVPKVVADSAMDAAQCIGCGACVAACPNGAANLFTAAQVLGQKIYEASQTPADGTAATDGDGDDADDVVEAEIVEDDETDEESTGNE